MQDYDVIADYIRKHESTRKSVYSDTSGKPTIGVGHLLKKGENPKKLNIEETFKKDLSSKIKLTKELFPKYDTYPIDVKKALVDGVYRGEHKKGHKTVEYINKGEWDKVPAEYINRKDYKESKNPIFKKSGIYKRMDENAGYFKAYGDTLERPVPVESAGEKAARIGLDLGSVIAEGFMPKERQ